MDLLRSAHIETVDLGVVLEFRLKREFGLLDHLLGVAGVSFLAYWAWRETSILLFVFAVAAVIGLGIHYLHGNDTLLRVSEDEIHAKGNLDSWLTTELRLSVGEVERLAWRMGGQGDAGGIYVSRGFMQEAWLLPGIGNEQARTVLSAIAERFPYWPVCPVDDSDGTPTLFGGGGDTIKLGLSGTSQEIAVEEAKSPQTPGRV